MVLETFLKLMKLAQFSKVYRARCLLLMMKNVLKGKRGKEIGGNFTGRWADWENLNL